MNWKSHARTLTPIPVPSVRASLLRVLSVHHKVQKDGSMKLSVNKFADPSTIETETVLGELRPERHHDVESADGKRHASWTCEFTNGQSQAITEAFTGPNRHMPSGILNRPDGRCR